MKRILLTFKEDGTVTSDAIGFVGKTCTQVTDKLLEALDAKLETRKLKHEYNVAVTEAESGAAVGT